MPEADYFFESFVELPLCIAKVCSITETFLNFGSCLGLVAISHGLIVIGRP